MTIHRDDASTKELERIEACLIRSRSQIEYTDHLGSPGSQEKGTGEREEKRKEEREAKRAQ